ncbi:alpha/beta hydrolase [Nocardia stercoris]|nr:alpha/beta hydrolase [Nocardia stercoris]
MSALDPEENALNFLSLPMHRGILQANVIARRLESIIREAGEGVAEKLYRGISESVRRGEYEFLTSDREVSRIIGEAERSAESSLSRNPGIGIPEDPAELREFWSGLSKKDKGDLFRADPFIGNRNGIPRLERDIYNRSTLQTLWDRAQASGDFSQARTYDEMTKLLYTSERGHPSFYLSYLDREGRFAIDLDDLDSADHAVVLLKPAARFPIDYAEDTMRQLRQTALRIDPKARTGVTFFGAYDNPHSMVQSMFPRYAEDGAAMARDFHKGLEITHEGPPAHTTTIGHSYGGVLAGHAAGHGATLNTDDMVFIGSWGTGVRNVGELSLSGVAPENIGEHVFATMAPSDSVQLMPKTHGPSPVDPSFGATVFGSSSTPGEYRWNPQDHSSEHYLDSGNPASRNIGLIITGNGALVK